MVVDKNQKFDIGRTMNPMKCHCEKCDFLNCNNYAKKMKAMDLTTKEFIEKNKSLLSNSTFRCNTNDLLYEFFDAFSFGLGKGYFWDSETGVRIKIVKFVNRQEATCCSISLKNDNYGQVYDGSSFFVTEKSRTIATKISKKLLEIESKSPSKAQEDVKTTYDKKKNN